MSPSDYEEFLGHQFSVKYVKYKEQKLYLE